MSSHLTHAGEISKAPNTTSAAQDVESQSAPVDQSVGNQRPEEIKLEFDELPLNWSASKKWTITILVAFISGTVTFASSVHASAVAGFSAYFHCTEVVATLGVTTYLLGFAAGPLVFGPVSEVIGRRIVFLFAISLFGIFNICCAVSPNVAAFMIFRFLSGCCGSPGITNAGGVLVDIWPQSHRTVPWALMTLGGSFGPILAPLSGGFIAQYTIWRWHYWLVSIISLPVFLAIVFLLPETYVTFLLIQKQHKAGVNPPKESLKQKYATSLARPWVMLATEPILFTLSLYSSFLWGVFYLDFSAFPFVFHDTRHWTYSQTGCSFLGIGLGLILSVTCSPLINKIHTRYVVKLGGSKPEARLPHLVVLAWIIPITMFWFGWSANPPTHWLVSISSGVPFGFSFLPLFLGTNAYLTDYYGRYSASALAAFSLMRNSFSAGFPLFAKIMYRRLGTSWATSLLGFVTLVMAPIPLLFYLYGPWLRQRSKFHLWTVKLDEDDAAREAEGTTSIRV